MEHLTNYSALKLLVEAGQAGLTATEIAKQFTKPDTHKRRSNRVSQIMRAMLIKGYVRAGTPEPTHFYHGHDVTFYTGAPVRRWYATPEAAEYVAGGTREEQAERQLERIAELARARQEAEEHRQAALAAAKQEVADRVAAGTYTKCWRYDKVVELRSIPCSLQEIGNVFMLTRERIRQIEAGREYPCNCAACQARTEQALGADHS